MAEVVVARMTGDWFKAVVRVNDENYRMTTDPYVSFDLAKRSPVGIESLVDDRKTEVATGLQASFDLRGRKNGVIDE